uniref:Uncharacterized protein n=1 Tax=Aegilops tauschii subsp. strangulata TaxID=200361 RepID=A0A453SET6_AEGTS
MHKGRSLGFTRWHRYHYLHWPIGRSNAFCRCVHVGLSSDWYTPASPCAPNLPIHLT